LPRSSTSQKRDCNGSPRRGRSAYRASGLVLRPLPVGRPARPVVASASSRTTGFRRRVWGRMWLDPAIKSRTAGSACRQFSFDVAIRAALHVDVDVDDALLALRANVGRGSNPPRQTSTRYATRQACRNVPLCLPKTGTAANNCQVVQMPLERCHAPQLGPWRTGRPASGGPIRTTTRQLAGPIALARTRRCRQRRRPACDRRARAPAAQRRAPVHPPVRR
jgi:hypothetical protein